MIIRHALAGQTIPVYGQGLNVRDWLYVTDHCQALIDVWKKSAPGEDYIVGARCAIRNLDVVHAVCHLLDSLSPLVNAESYRNQIQFVKDRPGHDYRYAVDPDNIMSKLGWKPAVTWEDGLRKTVQWYLAHSSWPRIKNLESSKGVFREPNLGTESDQS